MKINFMIVGTQKAGTTALYEYLKQHPQICMPVRKEAHFFDDDKQFKDNEPNYSGYHELFKVNENHLAIGDATPITMYWPNALDRVHDYNPDMKVIAILRNPIDRAYEHWWMEKSLGFEPLSFIEAVHAEFSRLKNPVMKRRTSYIDRGFYASQVKRMLNLFPNTTKIFLYEYYRSYNIQVVNEVCDFLGVDRMNDIEPLTANDIPGIPEMSEQVRTMLQGIYRDDIETLEDMLGLDLYYIWRR